MHEAVLYTRPELVLCNKIGTRPLAEAAERRRVRTVVAYEVIKLGPIDAPDRIDDEHFDVTPPELVDEIVTEEGSYPSDGVRCRVDRTPFLAEGTQPCAATKTEVAAPGVRSERTLA